MLGRERTDFVSMTEATLVFVGFNSIRLSTSMGRSSTLCELQDGFACSILLIPQLWVVFSHPCSNHYWAKDSFGRILWSSLVYSVVLSSPWISSLVLYIMNPDYLYFPWLTPFFLRQGECWALFHSSFLPCSLKILQAIQLTIYRDFLICFPFSRITVLYNAYCLMSDKSLFHTYFVQLFSLWDSKFCIFFF